jgi:hypothetical protein
MSQLAVAPFFDTDIGNSLTALAAFLTFGAAVTALIYARRELHSARDSARIDLTFRLYEHQLDPEFANHIALTADFITIDGDEPRKLAAERRWRRWQRMDRSTKAQIVLYLNHLEVVGGMYELDRLDETAAMRLFGHAAVEYWRRADWFVDRVRAKNPAAFDKWEALAKAYLRWKSGK